MFLPNYVYVVFKTRYIKAVWIKVTVHLQGCLAHKRWGASRLNYRYLKSYIKWKLIGLAIRLCQQFWKEMNCRNFLDFQMRAPESPFKRYMLERILCFAYLMCPSVSGAKALKIVSAICQVTEHFQNGIKNMECSYKNRSHWRNISKENIHRQVFAVYALIYPPSKFVGNRTNSLWVLVFYRFKWENWFEKTALNMSIRRVIFTSS